jgi:RNA polymerase sigma-70 factor (ECF subfamily)
MVVGGSIEELFRAEYARLVRALAVSAGGAEAAADAVQDAFVQANRHWARIGQYDDPAAWLRRVAVNRISNQRRARRRRTEALPRISIVSPTVATDAHPDLDLRALVAALPAQQRTAVCLYYLADLSVEEVSDAMGVAVGTVKSHLYDARRSLSSGLQEDHHG